MSQVGTLFANARADAATAAAAAEFIRPLLGLPWRSGAYGPDAFDCLGLVHVVQRDLFGRATTIELAPPGDVRALMRFVREHDERRKWRAAERPVHGALVEMAESRHPFHVGVWLDIDGGGIVHCARGTGVAFASDLDMRTAGWRRFVYHHWIGP
jgi:hypothetical protein